MHALVTPFVQLCLLRLRPQDLPASTTLLGLTVGAYAVSSLFVSLVSLDAGAAFLAALTDTVLVCGLNTGLLVARGLAVRVKQTLIAMTGTGTVIGVIALPIMTWLQAAAQPTDVANLAVLVLVGWSLTVSGHILRHALSVTLGVGIVISMIFYWVSIIVLKSLFPLVG